MSVIKVEDLAYVRFRAPDLDAMAEFLVDFGLEPLRASPDALYARPATVFASGTSPATNSSPPSRHRMRCISPSTAWTVASSNR